MATSFAQDAIPNLYWAPENVTVGGKKIDVLLNIIFWLTFAVFVATQTVYIYYLIKYRRRPGVKAHYSHGNNFLEIIWTSIPTVIFLVLAIVSNRVWFEIHSDPPADALKVNISSYQYGWDMRYAGADGQLGRIDVKQIGMENKFGLGKDDATAADDFTAMELVIPANRPVHIYLNARDVIHSFYVPQFRLYQDAVPGRTITWVWFEVIRPGNFELACSQLCGVGHYNMKAPIRVLPPEEFDKWYAEKSQAALEAKAGPPGVSSTVATLAEAPAIPESQATPLIP
ncbi:MAG: cytochrome c oxidase subunit II [Terrimicrobiaceae bacterium]